MTLEEFYLKYNDLYEVYKESANKNELVEIDDFNNFTREFTHFNETFNTVHKDFFFRKIGINIDSHDFENNDCLDTTQEYFLKNFFDENRVISKYFDLKTMIEESKKIVGKSGEEEGALMNFINFSVINLSNVYSTYYKDVIFDMLEFIYSLFEYFNERNLSEYSFEYLFKLDIITHILRDDLYDVSIVHKNLIGNHISYELEMLKKKQLDTLVELY